MHVEDHKLTQAVAEAVRQVLPELLDEMDVRHTPRRWYPARYDAAAQQPKPAWLTPQIQRIIDMPRDEWLGHVRRYLRDRRELELTRQAVDRAFEESRRAKADRARQAAEGRAGAERARYAAVAPGTAYDTDEFTEADLEVARGRMLATQCGWDEAEKYARAVKRYEVIPDRDDDADFSEADLAQARVFMLQHPGCEWDAAKRYALQNRGRPVRY
jgi:hypothetical protein